MKIERCKECNMLVTPARVCKCRLEESKKLIWGYLVRAHKDADDNSLFVRFSELMGRLENLELRYEHLKG